MIVAPVLVVVVVVPDVEVLVTDPFLPDTTVVPNNFDVVELLPHPHNAKAAANATQIVIFLFMAILSPL